MLLALGVVGVAPPPPASGRRAPGVPPLVDGVGGFAGDRLVGINTRAAADSSPLARALEISVAELGESGNEVDEDIDGGFVDGVVLDACAGEETSVGEDDAIGDAAGAAAADERISCRWCRCPC